MSQNRALIGRRFRTKVQDMEDDSDYGEVIHPVGSEFIVNEHMGHTSAFGDLYSVLWQQAVDQEGKPVPAEGMWTIWSEQDIQADATPV